MRQLNSLGVNKNGLDYLLSARFYAQIVRPQQLKYGLDITNLNLWQICALENYQNQCIRQIFCGRPFTSTKVMLHLPNLPDMKYCTSILQAQFLFRSSTLPNDALLTKMIPYTQTQRSSNWSHLSQSPLWQSLRTGNPSNITFADFKQKRKQFLIGSFHFILQEKHSKHLSKCCNDFTVDPTLLIPMTKSERSLCM